MRSIEERVSHLEAGMDEVTRAVSDVKSAIVALDLKLGALDQKFDQKLGALEQKFEQKLSALDQKMDRRFDRVESRFYWVLGVQFTILLAIIAGLFQIVVKLI